MLSALSSKHLVVLAALVSLGMLFFAYAVEWSGLSHPCQLCLWQRYGHIANIALGIFVLHGWFSPRLLLLLMAISFSLTGVLAGYHWGVEQHWWVFSGECTPPLSELSSSDWQVVLQDIQKRDIVRCDSPDIFLLGLSMAGWHMVACLVMAGVIWINLFRKLKIYRIFFLNI